MSEDIHGLIEWCPLCGKQLKDNTQKTRWEHDKLFHSDYFVFQTGIKKEDFGNLRDLK